jgi:protocatechuate 3,4-dioxygenase beta subunit
VRSGGDGGFVAEVDGLGCSFDLSASATGFAPAILEDVALSGPDVEIRLGSGFVVNGFVRDLDERPIAGAHVQFRGLAGRGRIRIGVSTDEAGRFSLAAIPEASSLTLGMARHGTGPATGEAHLFVQADGYAPQRAGVAIPEGPGAQDLVIHLAKGGVIEGTVRAADGGAPIAGAEVVVWTMEGFHGTRAAHGAIYRNPFGSRVVARGRTDDAGRYRIEHVPGGDTGLSGKVLHPKAGGAVDDTEVIITGEDGGVTRGRTSADGAFSFQGIAPGRYEITAKRLRGQDGVLTERPVSVTVRAGARAFVDVPLVEATRTVVEVIVTGADGAPAAVPKSGLDIALEDPNGQVVGLSFVTAAAPKSTVLSPSGPVKVIVRQAGKIVGTAEGIAGTEIRVPVRVD